MTERTYKAAEVRSELYQVRGDFEACKNEHITRARAITLHQRPCQMCNFWDIQMQAIDEAITHFGGKPRR